ncbi:MAG: UDP-2,3-diacylglucosamine diphosphatase [Pseudomonadota bacterium]
MTIPHAKYRSIFISDVHLGSKGCQADALCAFLKTNTSEKLYLVGDIIDGWRLKKKWYWPQAHTNVIRRILTASKRGTDVTYIIGNHDEFLRAFLRFRLSFGHIAVCNRTTHTGADGKTYLVVHGDMFDGMMRTNRKWIMFLGDSAYNFMLSVNTKLNTVRCWMGLPYWSLSNALKKRTKRALNYIHKFEDHVADYCRRKGYDGAICGHIHVAEMREIEGIAYMNDGDWVESCTALVEHHDGRWELIEHKPEAIKDRAPKSKTRAATSQVKEPVPA